MFCDEMYVVAGKTGNQQNERCFGESWDLIHDDRKYRNKKKSRLRAMCLQQFGGMGGVG